MVCTLSDLAFSHSHADPSDSEEETWEDGDAESEDSMDFENSDDQDTETSDPLTDHSTSFVSKESFALKGESPQVVAAPPAGSDISTDATNFATLCGPCDASDSDADLDGAHSMGELWWQWERPANTRRLFQKRR